ncbi:MAG TPA: rod shape-determining protein MreC [Pyrinomonadaceae bacterium]|jgi:rod shape-determining protein MreC|nr:rod shape-determining protein MreC [Pyrinomonadaceae bacterium]
MAAIRTQREIRQRAPIWLALLLLTNLVIMAVDARDNVTRQRMLRVWIQALASPAQSITSGASGAGTNFIRQIVNFRSTAAENERLKEELSRARLELRNAQQATGENERLKAILNLKEQTGYEQVAARVIARDSSAWFNTVTINRGSASGIALNMPVVTGSGIVGRVIALSPWTAQVMLVTDDKAAAGAIVGQLGGSGAVGSVKGLGENGLIEMRYVSGLEKVQTGDYILTTGQDGIYPPGLTVGEVVQIKPGTATQAHEILIRPGAKLDQLEDVAVLLYHAPPRPAPEQTLPNVDKTKEVKSER